MIVLEDDEDEWSFDAGLGFLISSWFSFPLVCTAGITFLVVSLRVHFPFLLL